MSTRRCTVCQRSHSTPDSYMLTCRNCRRYWHHTCHLPVITEEELMALVTASTRKLASGTLESWLCRRCKNRASAADAGGSRRSSAQPSSASGTIDLTTPQSNARTATHRVDVHVLTIDSDEEMQDASQMLDSFRSIRNENNDRTEVIELPDDDDIIEIIPTPARSTEFSRPRVVAELPPSQQRRVRSPSVEVCDDMRTEVVSRGTTGVPPAVPSGENLVPSAPPDVPHAESSPPPPVAPNQAGASFHLVPVLASGSSSVPDFRRLIADMRAQGKLGPSPTDQAVSRLLAYSSGMPVESTPIPMPVSPPDSDIEMFDAQLPATANEDPHDIEDMYAVPLAPVAKQEDPHDITDMYATPAPVKREKEDGFIPPQVRSVPKRKTWMVALQTYDDAEGSNEWTQLFKRREQRAGQPETVGTSRVRKSKSSPRKGIITNFEWAAERTKTRSTQISQQQRWMSGILALERLFG